MHQVAAVSLVDSQGGHQHQLVGILKSLLGWGEKLMSNRYEGKSREDNFFAKFVAVAARTRCEDTTLV